MISTSAAASLMVPEAPADAPLPPAGNVLAVTARPGQESADLGGLLYAFRRTGASLALLCLTRGEASPLNSTSARLEAIRPWELQLAASILGISRVTGGQLPRRHTLPVSDGRTHRPGTARDPPALGGPATGHRPGGGRPGRHRRSHGCLRCRQAGRRAGHGAHSAACPRQLDDRSGHRSRRRPRHPEIRRGRARQPVRRIAPADTPP
jgi:hypothetical protein